MKETFFRRILFLVCGGVGLILLWMVVTEYRVWLEKSETFCIRKIELHGLELLSEADIFQLCGLVPRSSIWEVNLEEISERIASNAFVEKIRVDRRLPDILRIRVEEKRPVALLNFQGNFFSVDREGLVLPSKPGKLYDLPVLSGAFRGAVRVGGQVTGRFVQQGLCFLILILEDRPELYNRISEIVVGRPEGLTLYTSRGGVPIWVGEGGYGWKIRYLEAILDEVVRGRKFSQIRYIDLRFVGQIVVGMRA